MPYRNPAKVPYSMTGPAIVKIFAPTPSTKPSACVKIGHINFLLFSNFTIQSNGNQLFLLIGSSSGQLSNCFYDFLSEIIVTPEINLYSSIFIDTDLLYQFPKVFWAVLIQKLNTLGICF
jgi:hypothetical protein